MENASKALLMAAGVLIGILILTLAVYLFLNFGGTSATIHNRIQKDQINKFNSQFTKYEAKDSITIYDVISIANLATENNIANQLNRKSVPTNGEDNYITVSLNSRPIEGGINTNLDQLEEEYNEKIKNDVNTQKDGKLKKYRIKTTISDITERVYLVEIIEKK